MFLGPVGDSSWIILAKFRSDDQLFSKNILYAHRIAIQVEETNMKLIFLQQQVCAYSAWSSANASAHGSFIQSFTFHPGAESTTCPHLLHHSFMPSPSVSTLTDFCIVYRPAASFNPRVRSFYTVLEDEFSTLYHSVNSECPSKLGSAFFKWNMC